MPQSNKNTMKLEYKTVQFETLDKLPPCEYCGGVTENMELKSVRLKRDARFLELFIKHKARNFRV